MVNYLVTGATGQIGAFVCEELVKKGHKVVCYDFKPNMENVSHIAGSIKVVNGDVSNLDELLSVLKQESVERVIHLAAMVLMDSIEHPAKAYQVNIMGTNNVLESARLLDLKKVVLASSVSVYGDTRPRREGVVDEDDSLNPPDDPYSTSKVANELMGRFYLRKFGLSITCLRLTSAWGPGRYWGYTGQFNDFIRRVSLGQDAKFPEDFSYKESKLRWMYVKDAARAFTHVSEFDNSPRYLYNVGSKSPFSYKDVVAALHSIFPERHIEVVEREEPTTLSQTVAGPNGLDVDCSRLYRELGFEAEFTLESALRDMANFERSKAKTKPA
jgi:UDP-glucose 4-epimerase